MYTTITVCGDNSERGIANSCGPVEDGFSLKLPNAKVLASAAQGLRKDFSWQLANFRNASTIDNRTSNCNGSDGFGAGSRVGGSESTLRHYRSFSATPRVCLSGRELFAKENKPKQVVPGNGDSIQTITSGSISKLRLRPDLVKHSLLA